MKLREITALGAVLALLAVPAGAQNFDDPEEFA